MKITNADVIKSGEKDLIDSITADLDWRAIEDIFLTEHNLGIDEDIEYKRGDIIAYENQVAYKLEFTVKVNLSVLINRDGEYLSVDISEKRDHQAPVNAPAAANESTPEAGPEQDAAQKNVDSGDGMQNSEDHAFQQNPATAAEEANEDKYIEALEQLDSNDFDNSTGNVVM
jgi:hypothetical protein